MNFGWNKIRIAEIRNEAHKFLYKEFNGADISNPIVVNIYYYFVPIIIALLLCFLDVKIDKDTATYFITGISIFAGLFFNLLLVVADKMSKRKKMISSKKEEISHYGKLYKNFSEQLIAYISYAILLSIALIILMFFTQVNIKFVSLIQLDIEYLLSTFFNFCVFFFGYQFAVILIIILSNMYIMLIDDINLEE